MKLENRVMHCGDVLDQLKLLPSNSIDCIITSPPYYALRNYGVEGQMGCEPNFQLYLKKLRLIMDQCKRILKPTGSCWINLGDTYAGSGKGAGTDPSNCKESFVFDKKPKVGELTIRAKSLMGIPQRFMIQCIDDGWICRNVNIWYKSNAMPSSGTDNFTNKYENLFFFVKNNLTVFAYNEKSGKSVPKQPKIKKGGIDWEYRKCNTCNGTGYIHGELHKRCNGNGIFRYSFWHNRDYHFDLNTVRVKPLSTKQSGRPKNSTVEHEQSTLLGAVTPDEIKDATKKQDNVLGADGKPKANYAGFNKRWSNRKNADSDETIKHDHSGCYDSNGKCLNNPIGKNPGDVFFINPKPFKEAHFATFPPELPTKMLLCSCPKQVCSQCGIPRYPISQATEAYAKILAALEFGSGTQEEGAAANRPSGNITAQYKTVGYSQCRCGKPFIPGMVLDPFMGAGTTALAAEQLGLRWRGIELNQEYIEVTSRRLESFKNQSMEENN